MTTVVIVLRLFEAILLFGYAKYGLATTFSSANDPGNPNPLCYCNNQVLKDDDLVVAHPTLPCRSKVFLYNPRTRKRIIAKVMDRGPRHAMIDLSEGATKALKSNKYEKIFMLPLGK